MIKIGEINKLTVVKVVDFGVYLDGGEEWGEILMPNEYVPDNCFPDDEVEAFIYFDSEDRIVATTEDVYAKVGEFAYLKVVATTGVGAFLDWGLKKDLLVPFREQRDSLIEGKSYLVYVYVDKDSDRIAATTKIEKYIDLSPVDYQTGQEVEILIARKTDLGYAVIINNAHWGVIYLNEIFRSIKIGEKTKAYIKLVREDKKIDISLQAPIGYMQIAGLAKEILDKLNDYGGTLDISDKSAPEDIYNVFGCSKKNYKKALGSLLKQGIIEIDNNEVRLITGE